MTSIKQFDFDLPSELIANYPAQDRDGSRLMVLDCDSGVTTEENVFLNIKDYFKPGDLLIFNDTKVMKARLKGVKPSGGAVEVFFLDKVLGGSVDGGFDEVEQWHLLVKSSKPLKVGAKLTVIFNSDKSDIEVTIIIKEKDSKGIVLAFVDCPISVFDLMDKYGLIPLPPYIKRDAEEIDQTRYQTVYADKAGAVAAPTAGLHFTPELIEDIKDIGVDVEYLTLHTGAATFLPVRTETVEEHEMAFEYYNVSRSLYEKIVKAKKDGNRVIAVGTTVTRTLESIFSKEEVALEGRTDIFIYPPYDFKAVDAMLTNFHLPQSTLLMLVSAFAGKEFVMEAYARAVKEKYRFFSYGDAMFIK